MKNNSDNNNLKDSCGIEISVDINYKQHWNNAYTKTSTTKLGWYEENPEPSLRLIKQLNLDKSNSILNVGAGTSTLIGELCNEGYQNIIVNDISSTALGLMKENLKSSSEVLTFIEDDLSNPTKLNTLENIHVWHDRAVLHFLTESKDQDVYFKLLSSVLNKDGYAIIATFNKEGATRCCGLPVCRYNSKELKDKLGKEFELIESFNYSFITPSDDTREYIYTLFRKK
ncbi:methyltransferase domain-containing protein [Bacteroidota bacterium]